MPTYTATCTCGNTFHYMSPIVKRNDPTECDCGLMANRDVEAELAPSPMIKLITNNERWSLSMGVPISQLSEFRKRFPNSTYDDKGRLLVKSRKDKLRQCNERSMVELS